MTKKIFGWNEFERMSRACVRCGGIENGECDGVYCEHWTALKAETAQKKQTCPECKKEVYTLYFRPGLHDAACGSCKTNSYIGEISALKTEVERLRAENNRLVTSGVETIEYWRCVFQSRARAWKRCARRTTVITKPTPGWKDEARAYMRGEIQLEGPTDNGTSRVYGPTEDEEK